MVQILVKERTSFLRTFLWFDSSSKTLMQERNMETLMKETAKGADAHERLLQETLVMKATAKSADSHERMNQLLKKIPWIC